MFNVHIQSKLLYRTWSRTQIPPVPRSGTDAVPFSRMFGFIAAGHQLHLEITPQH